MSLKKQLQDDVTEAMRSGDVNRRDTLRLLLAAVKQEEVDHQTQLDDAGVEAVLAKQAKQRRETIVDAEKAGREEMVAKEAAELAVVESYLPEMMTRDEIRVAAEAVVSETGASGMQDMGKVMSQLMPKLQGNADGRLASEVVRELLQN
jgi:uncharacterized protein YqeY